MTTSADWCNPSPAGIWQRPVNPADVRQQPNNPAASAGLWVYLRTGTRSSQRSRLIIYQYICTTARYIHLWRKVSRFRWIQVYKLRRLAWPTGSVYREFSLWIIASQDTCNTQYKLFENGESVCIHIFRDTCNTQCKLHESGESVRIHTFWDTTPVCCRLRQCWEIDFLVWPADTDGTWVTRLLTC